VGWQVDRALRIDANYTHYGFHLDQASFFPGDTILPNTPPHTANLSAAWQVHDDSRVRVGLRYEDAYHWRLGLWNGPVPASLSVDLNASTPLSNGVVLGLVATNLFDQQRFHDYGGSLVGRQLLATMSWRP
jgi:outer membrane receptor protein involved in Fe transport